MVKLVDSVKMNNQETRYVPIIINISSQISQNSLSYIYIKHPFVAGHKCSREEEWYRGEEKRRK